MGNSARPVPPPGTRGRNRCAKLAVKPRKGMFDSVRLESLLFCDQIRGELTISTKKVAMTRVPFFRESCQGLLWFTIGIPGTSPLGSGAVLRSRELVLSCRYFGDA